MANWHMNRRWKRCVVIACTETGTGMEQALVPELPTSKDKGNYKEPKYDQSLFKALFQTFFFQIWTAGILKLMAGKFQD